MDIILRAVNADNAIGMLLGKALIGNVIIVVLHVCAVTVVHDILISVGIHIQSDIEDIFQESCVILMQKVKEGGLVVVPNGTYRLTSAIIVPENVEIRSTQSVFSRSSHTQTARNGVVFVSYVSGVTFTLKENAGIVAVRIWHPKNDFLTAQAALNSGSYPNDISIKAEGEGAYAYMNESVGAYVGYDFSSCDKAKRETSHCEAKNSLFFIALAIHAAPKGIACGDFSTSTVVQITGIFIFLVYRFYNLCSFHCIGFGRSQYLTCTRYVYVITPNCFNTV